MRQHDENLLYAIIDNAGDAGISKQQALERFEQTTPGEPAAVAARMYLAAAALIKAGDVESVEESRKRFGGAPQEVLDQLPPHEQALLLPREIITFRWQVPR